MSARWTAQRVDLLPISTVTPDNLDSLALRKGDSTAEAKALEAVTPVVLSIVTRLLRASSLRSHAEDLRSEGLISALKAIRRYDARQGHLMPYLIKCVTMELRRAAKQLYSSIGAHVATNNQDLEFGDPAFQARHQVFDQSIPAAPIDDPERELASNRQRLFLWLHHRGLSPFERELILRRWGVYWRRASAASGFYRREAQAMRPHSLADIGRDYDLSSERIRQLQEIILEKLGQEARPTMTRRSA